VTFVIYLALVNVRSQMFIATQKVPENYKKEMRNLQSAKQKFDAKEDIQGQKTAMFRKLLADVKGNIYIYGLSLALFAYQNSQLAQHSKRSFKQNFRMKTWSSGRL